MRWIRHSAAAMRLCMLSCGFSWLCAAASTTLLLRASRRTANSHSKQIWAFASKDASWRCASMWLCAFSLCCFMAV